MRTRIQSIDENRVILTCDVERLDPSMGGTISIEYWSPSGGGYVYEIDEQHPGTLGRQVCEFLGSLGSTLHWSGRQPLVDMIRREWKRARRDELRREVSNG